MSWQRQGYGHQGYGTTAGSNSSTMSIQRNVSSYTQGSSDPPMQLDDSEADLPPPPPLHRYQYLNQNLVVAQPHFAERQHSMVISPSSNAYNGPKSPPLKDQFARPPEYAQPGHQHSDSQNSLTPLMAAGDALSSRHSIPRRPISSSRHDWDVPGTATYFHGDGYDDFDPRTIIDDDEEANLEESQSNRSSRVSGKPVVVSSEDELRNGFSNSRLNINQTYGSRGDPEKSEWLQSQTTSNNKLRWIVGIIAVVLILAIIIGGVAGGLLSRNHDNSTSKSSKGSSSSGGSSNGLWTIKSPEIQAVLNNKNLHKVFPGMDYTPMNAQYPECLSLPIDQNNVTLDMAILSQLTPAIRLYGTDCGQTEAVLTGINQLGCNNSMTVWLGVYLGNNDTTNSRQISQMYSILANNSPSRFSGIIIGNEALYAGSITPTTLSNLLVTIRSNLTAMSINLPVATSQLGDDWPKYPLLASSTDILMANIHPFFAGVPASQGASWAWNFLATNDLPLTVGSSSTTTTTTSSSSSTNTTTSNHIISEIGWPTSGGRDCGDASLPSYGCLSSTPYAGAVANVTELNAFMDSWVCGALANTTYFWFEAFDEPWKHVYDTQYDGWEPHWGLFDAGRVLKEGVVVPDCGGRTVGA